MILPVFNHEKTIQTAVDSILNQTFEDFELLIINDGCTDYSIKKILTNKDSRIRIISKEHTGLSDSLNTGIKNCQGKYIARMDADDICDPARFHEQYNYLQENKHWDVCATQVVYSGPEESEGLRHYISWQNKLLDHDSIYLNRFVDAPIVHPTVMIRKSTFHRFGAYTNKNEPEDFQLWLHWLDLGARFHKIDKPLLTWTDSPTRLTRIHPNYKRDNFFRLKAHYFSLWFKRTYTRYIPELWVCGVGKDVNQRVKWLKQFGLEIRGYIDVKSRTQSNVIDYDRIYNLNNPFFLSYVSDRKGREDIREFLLKGGLHEGINFYMMS